MALVRYNLHRLFSNFSASFNKNYQHTITDFVNFKNTTHISITPSKKYGSYVGSPTIDKYQGIVAEYEIVQNPAEWKFVEKLLPIETVPKAPEAGVFPSGWKPQNPELYEKLPYFVKRTKNHMIPVDLVLSKRYERRMTKIRYIFGDIWELADDLRNYLQTKHQRVFAIRVNEFCSFIEIRGDLVLDTREYLLSVGL